MSDNNKRTFSRFRTRGGGAVNTIGKRSGVSAVSASTSPAIRVLVERHEPCFVCPMTIKAIMVDVDGVLIVHPHPQGWSVNLEKDIGLSASKLRTAFFERHWDDVIHGRASLRERLAPVLTDISPDITYETVIDYWFSNDAHLNHGCGVDTDWVS